MVELITIDKEAFKIVETKNGYIIRVFPTEILAEEINRKQVTA